MEKYAKRKNKNKPLLLNKDVCYSQQKKRTEIFDSVLQLQSNFVETSCIYFLKRKKIARYEKMLGLT